MTSGELQFSQFDLEDIKQFNQLELEASFSDVEEEEDFSRRREIINILECSFAWHCGNNNSQFSVLTQQANMLI